jgi:hypothetical protein
MQCLVLDASSCCHETPISRRASTISLIHIALAFMPAFVFPRRSHPDFALLRLLGVMLLVNNVTASRGRLTLLTPFRERL